MTIAVVILAVLAAAQQLFNALILRAVAVDRSEVVKLADSVSELADATLDLAMKVLPKEKAPAKGKRKAAKK